jgi:RNA polymerase sigma factor (sigma-70 family)
MALEEQLFRHAAGKMVTALTRVFGVHNLALAEDVVQDALCRALEVWKFRGVPDNPTAWLMTAAKNRALDVLRRERTARTFAPELGSLLESEWTVRPALDELLSPGALRDDELRMMFSCCHPRLPEEAQVALVLNILCGFGVREIASAFLCTHAAMEKRILRGKKLLATTKTLFELGAAEEFPARLGAVQRALYLLFNEGYHGAGAAAVRTELCDEAMRLVAMLLDHPPAATPTTHALAALMCFHAARGPARLDGEGDLIPLAEQDRALGRTAGLRGPAPARSLGDRPGAQRLSRRSGHRLGACRLFARECGALGPHRVALRHFAFTPGLGGDRAPTRAGDCGARRTRARPDGASGHPGHSAPRPLPILLRGPRRARVSARRARSRRGAVSPGVRPRPQRSRATLSEPSSREMLRARGRWPPRALRLRQLRKHESSFEIPFSARGRAFADGGFFGRVMSFIAPYGGDSLAQKRAERPRPVANSLGIIKDDDAVELGDAGWLGARRLCWMRKERCASETDSVNRGLHLGGW